MILGRTLVPVQRNKALPAPSDLRSRLSCSESPAHQGYSLSGLLTAPRELLLKNALSEAGDLSSASEITWAETISG